MQIQKVKNKKDNEKTQIYHVQNQNIMLYILGRLLLRYECLKDVSKKMSCEPLRGV